jgi:CBS domain-containing protein
MPTVREFMTKDVVTIDTEKTVFEAAELMAQKGTSDLVVCDGKKPIGIITERDFVRRVVAKRLALDSKVSEIMTTPLWVVYADNSLNEAARKMVARKIRRLPVFGEERVGWDNHGNRLREASEQENHHGRNLGNLRTLFSSRFL